MKQGICHYLVVTLLITCVMPSAMRAQPAYSATKNAMVIYYTPEHSYILPHLERCFENALKFHSTLFDYTSSEKVTVILHDFNDYGSGGATPLPWNFLNIGIEPYDYVYETGPSNERMNWVMNHELAHIVATDRAAGIDDFFRTMFFGKVSPTADNPLSMLYGYLTTPRWYCPRWYHEGFAVFLETWMAGGIGRLLGGYDEMTFRAMVNDSTYFYDFVGIESEGKTIDFQVGANSYLYGTRFLAYLAYTYGPDRLLKWVNRTNDSKRYFAAQFEHVYGISLDDAWGHWVQWEHRWQRANLDSIRQHAVTPYRKVVDQALGSVSRTFYDSTSREIYTAMNLPGQLAQIVSIDIDRGTMRKICDVPTPALYYVASLAYDPSTSTLFYTTHNSRDWRGINAVDISTGETKELLKDARIGDLVVNPRDRSLIGVQHHNGYSNIVTIAPPYTSWNVILGLKYGLDIFYIDVSPDGRYLTGCLIEISGKQTLIRFELEKLISGGATFETLIEFDNNTAPYNFVYSRDGRYLFGTSYFTGVSNVIRYDIEKRVREWISNCETGFFRPLQLSDDSLLVYRYTGKGFLPVVIANKPTTDVSPILYLGQQIVEKYPVLESWTIPSPMTINLDSFSVSSGRYHAVEHLNLASAYPVVEGYKDFAGYGLRLDIADPASEQVIDLTASYTPNRLVPPDERFHATLNYNILNWQLGATYNGADFYDLFGPTKTSRKGDSFDVRYSNYLIYDRPRTLEFTLVGAGYGGLERLPDFQNVSTSFDKFYTLSGKLDYSLIRRSLGAVDAEAGIRWKLTSNNTYVAPRLFPRVSTSIDLGFLLPLNHSSIWLRSSGGYAGTDYDEPFDNFYFGGFGNNWVDHQEEKRYRESYSFPGLELNEAGGTHYGKFMIEWTLPPLRFRRLGFPIMYCNWARFALFSAALSTNFTNTARRQTFADVGAQIDFKLVIFSMLESTLSVGYAAAWEKHQLIEKEFMASLKILR